MATRSWASRLATGVLALVVTLAVAVGIAAALGYRTEVILTGSMRPTLAPDDMVLVHGIAARDMKVGDIVSFEAPEQKGVVITHRVRALSHAAAGRIAVTTRGDANNTSEHWTISPSGSVARVVSTLPGAGAIADVFGGVWMRLILMTAIGGVALVGGLRWIWSRP